MTHKLMLGVAAVAAILVPAARAAGAGTSHKCGNEGAMVGRIQATNTSCSVARKVVAADVQGKRYDGWTCRSKPHPAGATVTCTHKGAKKVTFQIAD